MGRGVIKSKESTSARYMNNRNKRNASEVAHKPRRNEYILQQDKTEEIRMCSGERSCPPCPSSSSHRDSPPQKQQ